MVSVESRLTALADALQRRQMIQTMPVDGLSASLFAWGRELAELNEQGKIALLEAMNSPSEDGTVGLDLDMEALERMIEGAKR